MLSRRTLEVTRVVLPIAAIMVAEPAAAQDGAMQQCLAIKSVKARVACYDRLARGEGAVVEQQAGRPGAAAAPPRRIDPKSDFGLDQGNTEARMAARSQRIDALELKVSAARAIGAEGWEFTMADGSLWRLAETSHAFRAPRPGDSVALERAALGSYLLRFDRQQALRIRRVR